MSKHGFLETAALIATFNTIAAVLALAELPFLGRTPEEVTPTAFLVPAGATYTLFLFSHLLFASKQQQSNSLLSLIVSLTVPFNVGIVIPSVLVLFDAPKRVPIELLAVGGVIRAAGLGMLLWTVTMFYMHAQGTLSPAPWLETKKLLVHGPYAYTRNPMICGVAIELTGFTVMTQSPRTAVYLVSFFVIKTLWFVLCEEPSMLCRFGAEFEHYTQHVPRWVPRLTPYNGASATVNHHGQGYSADTKKLE